MVGEMSRQGGEDLGGSLRLGGGVQDSKLHCPLDRPTKLKERRDQVSLAALPVTSGFGSTLTTTPPPRAWLALI